MAIKPVEILIKARDEASGIFSTLQGKVAAVGVAIAGYFGISAFIGAVKGASELEAKLSEVKAVSGATAAEMVLLRKAAEEAGASTKFNATEAADALGNLTRSGLSAKDSIAALPAVLTLAQAGGIGLSEASDYVTKAVMGMGLAFSDAGRVADVLAAGANASNTSVTGLAQALSYAAPVANSLGLSLETTVAIIGKFADAGIDASRAGTALNAILSQFADPASKFRQELASAGITTGNFEKALRQLAAAGPAGGKAILAVGTEAGPALRALLNQGIGALDDLKGKLDAAKGSASATAAVMEDNLKGSFNSLSSAWDSVKNALATPLLPVLKDGVTQLAAAFSGAVSDGTIGKFGDAIASAFQGGIKWVKAFAAETDFTALAARLQAFAASTQEAFTKIGEYATNAGNIVKTVYGVMSAGTNAVLMVVYGLGVAFAGVAAQIQNGLAVLYEGMAKITFGNISAGYKQLAADIRRSADATSAASHALATKAIESFTAMGDGAQLASEGVVSLVNATKDAGTQTGTSAAVFKTVAQDLAAVGTAATDAGNKATDSGDRQQAAASASKEKVAALRGEYEAAVATGNWQLAAEKMTALANAANAAKGGMADLRKKAEEDAAAIAASFERMGIKTKAELKTAADVALQDFDRIKASGLATTDGLSTAFKKVAESAIAANGGVVTEVLKSRAAMYGLEIQTDNTGKAIVKAMDGGSESVNRFARNVGASLEDIKRMEAALDAINAKYGQSKADLAGKYSRPGEGPNRSVLTKDDMRPVDNTGLYSLEQKRSAGTLSKDDLATAEGAFKVAATNLDAMQKNISGLGLTAIQSIQADYNASRAILERVKALDSQANAPQPSRNTQANSDDAQKVTAKTYTVNLNLGGSKTAINTSSDADAQALIRLLQNSKLSAGL